MTPPSPRPAPRAARLVRMDLEAVRDELYGLTPQEFTPARDARAAEARSSGQRELAAAIKQLKRPSQAAWLANVLARQRPHRVDELLLLGDRLRDAQRRLAGEELKELARAGHGTVAELVTDVERLAASAGQRPGPASLRQLQETLDAGLADREAGRALREGCLTVALSYAGLGSPVGDDGDERAGAPSAERATARSRARRAEAERRVAELTAELQSAERRRDRVREQIDELEHQLRQVKAQEADAARSIDELQAAIAAVSREMDETEG